MIWYDYLIYLAILVGVMYLVAGVYHHKHFALGLTIIIFALIVKAFVWILGMT